MPDRIWIDSIIEIVSCRPLIVNARLELLVERLFSLTPAKKLLKLRVVDFKPILKLAYLVDQNLLDVGHILQKLRVLNFNGACKAFGV